MVLGQGGAETQNRVSIDPALVAHYLIVIDGKPAAWAKPPKRTNAAKLDHPPASQFGRGGGDVAMEELTIMSTEFGKWIQASV